MTAIPQAALEAADCPLGCPRADEKLLIGRDRLYGLPGEFPVVRCRSCGLIRTDPRPTADSMAFYYPDEYVPHRDTQWHTSDLRARPRWRRAASALLARLTNTNAERLPRLPPGRMLEIGCASGAFLHRMAKQGWEVEGIEFSQNAGQKARGLGYPVHIGQLETAPEPRKPYDLIVGWMVLEHLHEPVLALRKLRDWTKPGGCLVVSVPNAGCYELSLFKDAWYSLHLPNHLWHPTSRTLARVLDRGGWRLERTFYQRDLGNVVGSLGYVLKDRGMLVSLGEWMARFPERGGRLYLFLHPFAYLLSLLRQTGRMTVWARRTDD